MDGFVEASIRQTWAEKSADTVLMYVKSSTKFFSWPFIVLRARRYRLRPHHPRHFRRGGGYFTLQMVSLPSLVAVGSYADTNSWQAEI